MGEPGRAGDHQWSQQHLSHYVEGELRPRGPAAGSTGTRGTASDCGRGLRAMRAVVHALQGLDGLAGARAPATIFDRVRLAGPGGAPSSQNA